MKHPSLSYWETESFCFKNKIYDCTCATWLRSPLGFWYQFSEHCWPHSVPSLAHTHIHIHSAEECLTINLIRCLVCFVWGVSEEGLALWLIDFLEYTPLSSSLIHPLSSSIIFAIPWALSLPFFFLSLFYSHLLKLYPTFKHLLLGYVSLIRGVTLILMHHLSRFQVKH